MASHAKLEKRVEEQAAEIERLKAGLPPESVGAGSSGLNGSSTALAPPDLMAASERGDTEAVRAALQANQEVKNAKNRFGRTPLMEAARKGHVGVIDILVAAGADRDERNKFGQTAADWALEQGHTLAYARLDPEGARAKADALRREFAAAEVVHVLSSRPKKDASQLDRTHPDHIKLSCDPCRSAEALQRYVQEGGAVVRCFNPHAEGALLTDGDVEQAHGWYVLNWRSAEFGLERARRSGGCVLQLLVPPGPSPMQIAEAEMAREKGVRVIVVDCTAIRGEAFDYQFAEMPDVRQLSNVKGVGGATAAAGKERLEPKASLQSGQPPAGRARGREQAPTKPAGAAATAEEPEPDFDA